MLGVGEKFPEFRTKATVSLDKGKEFTEITNDTTPESGKYISSGLRTSRSFVRRRSPHSAS